MQQDLKDGEALYAQPGVSELCLEAQDRQNLDVMCLLLAGLWLEKRGEVRPRAPSCCAKTVGALAGNGRE